MNKSGRQAPNSQMEYVITFLLSVNFISMFIFAMNSKWDTWFPGYTIACTVVIWAMAIGKFQTLKTRVIIDAILLDAAFVIYSYYASDMLVVFIPFCATTVLFALYGFEAQLILNILTAILMYLIQALWVKSIDFSNTRDISNHGVALFNLILICLILLFWNRMRAIVQMNVQETLTEMAKVQKGKDDFLANVSHEIRTPINTISGLSDIIMTETDPAKLRDDLNRIRIASRSLMLVVTDILDFSELGNQEIVLEEETYNISSSINDLINMSIAQKGNKPIEFIVNYESDLPRGLVGDEKRIRRAVMNVVGNAFKFTHEGCIVLDISHRVEEYGVNLVFTVRDTGIGMKPEELEKLFSTYNQADSSRARTEGGIGLGLAITRNLVRNMGGTISIHSDYEKGTETRIVIPQKVSDERPIITINEPKEKNVCIFLSLEEYEPNTRDEYTNAIRNMMKQLNLKATFCRSLAEVKRRQSENQFTHMFTSLVGYREDEQFFDLLAKKLHFLVVLDDANSDMIHNPDIYQVYKPFHIMPIAQALNNEISKVAYENAYRKARRFEAPGVKVLVVDDNEMNIRVIGGLLKRYKIGYEPALSGAEALALIETKDYDFVFMDHMMPEMDGVECLHRLREKSGKYYKSVPVVALTANAVAGARDMLLAEGFDDFIEKPVELSVLERMLQRILPEEKQVIIEDEQVEEEQNQSEEPNVEHAQGEDAQKEQKGNYTYDSLNFANGYLYCGDEESFEIIIDTYAKKGDANFLPLQECFDNEDWKNYTIAIHAVKSSMKAIGADLLSEEARLLEMAGREERIDYIKENHDRVYDMYKSLIIDIMKRSGIEYVENVSEEQAVELPEISEVLLAEIKGELEKEMFNFDGDAMLAVVSKAKGLQRNGKAVDAIIEQMKIKIESSDYMSAADLFLKL